MTVMIEQTVLNYIVTILMVITNITQNSNTLDRSERFGGYWLARAFQVSVATPMR